VMVAESGGSFCQCRVGIIRGAVGLPDERELAVEVCRKCGELLCARSLLFSVVLVGSRQWGTGDSCCY
jgi:hypothetical protein